MLDNIWKSKTLSKHTKIRIFNSNVKSVLLYGSETWRTTKALSKKVQVFINKCLRRILGIKWQDKISNEEILARTEQTPVDVVIKNRKWRWIRHTLRKNRSCIAKQALKWTPQGTRHQGRPRKTWKRGVETELKMTSLSWSEADKLVQDRAR